MDLVSFSGFGVVLVLVRIVLVADAVPPIPPRLYFGCVSRVKIKTDAQD